MKGDTWYHLAATYDGESLKAYKDGVLTGENGDPSGDADSGTSTLIFGRHATAKDAFFTGAVDDVSVFAYALDANDVQALHGGKEPTAIAAPPVASAPKLLQATLADAVQPAVVSSPAMLVAADPNSQVQPVSARPAASETTSRSGKNGIAVVVIIAIVGVIAGVSFFTKQKSQ